MEQQAEGVMQEAGESQASTPDSSPESTQSSGMQGSDVGSEGSEIKQGSKDYNFKQLRESVNRLETERKQWLEREKSLEGAAQIDQILRTDPKNGLKQIAQALGIDIKTLIDAQQPANEIPQIDFGQYDSETAQLLKFLHDKASKVGKLEEWKNEFEQKIEQNQRQSQEQTINQNVSTLESNFYQDLIKEGFLDKNGQGNMELVEVIKDSIIFKLAQKGDPRLASPDQYKAAFTQVCKGLSAHKNKTLQNTVTTSVPSSGSKNGSATTAKPSVTREQRISMLEGMAKSNPNWGFES